MVPVESGPMVGNTVRIETLLTHTPSRLGVWSLVMGAYAYGLWGINFVVTKIGYGLWKEDVTVTHMM